MNMKNIYLLLALCLGLLTGCTPKLKHESTEINLKDAVVSSERKNIEDYWRPLKKSP